MTVRAPNNTSNTSNPRISNKPNNTNNTNNTSNAAQNASNNQYGSLINTFSGTVSNGFQAVTNMASLGSTAATAFVDTNAGIEAGHFMAQLMQRLSLAAALDNITKKLGEQMKSPTQ